MWQWLASFLGGPVVNGLINAYKAKLAAGNTTERIAADLAARELAVQQMEIAAQSQLKVAEIGHPWEPEKLFAYVVLIYFAKAIVFDKVIGAFLGHSCFRGECSIFNTDAIHGDVLTWAGMIMLFLFGKRGIENVVRIIKR